MSNSKTSFFQKAKGAIAFLLVAIVGVVITANVANGSTAIALTGGLITVAGALFVAFKADKWY